MKHLNESKCKLRKTLTYNLITKQNNKDTHLTTSVERNFACTMLTTS